MQAPQRPRWPLLSRLLLPALLVAAALWVEWSGVGARERLRQLAFDQLQQLQPAPFQAELPLRVVAIDEASLAALGQWPWTRSRLAELIDRLAALEVAAVALDLVLAEPDRSSPQRWLADWPPGVITDPLRRLVEQLPDHDRQFAAAIARAPVVLAQPVRDGPGPQPAPKANFIAFGGDALATLEPQPGVIPPLPQLAAEASGIGIISLPPAGDGVVRAMPLLHRIGDRLHPGFALEALRVGLGSERITLRVAPASWGQPAALRQIAVDDLALPTATGGRIWPHFRHYRAERYLSAQAVLAGTVAPELLAGHIVFIGATAEALGDMIQTPLGERVPGIEGHLQLTEQLISGDYLLPFPWERDLLVAVLLLTWGAMALLLAKTRPHFVLIVPLAVVTALVAASLWLFTQQRQLFDPLFPALAVVLLATIMLLPRLLEIEREQRFIRDAFARYVSPNRVRWLQAHPEALSLGAEYRDCSFVMSDLEGFTSLMERHPPDTLEGLLNDYLDGMIAIAFRHDGTLDRIVGDAVAVIFSAPLAQADHPRRALACALEMDAFAEQFALTQRARGIPFGSTRIGVHSGRVLVGNFGGRLIMDYRALGDPINTAARLEQVNGQLGTRLLVSAATAAAAPAFLGRTVGELVFKGKREAVLVYAPQPQRDELLEQWQALYPLLAAAAASAEAQLSALAARWPEDPLIRFHAARWAAGERGMRVVLSRK